jgi:hypothetical protein
MTHETFGRFLRGAIASIAHLEGKTTDIIDDELESTGRPLICW